MIIEDFLLGVLISWGLGMIILMSIDISYYLRNKESPIWYEWTKQEDENVTST